MIILGEQAADAVTAAGLEDSTETGLVAKELLHYDILAEMQRAGFLDRLVFHGGTALRLCHGAPRLSEDLDFSGGKGFEPAGFATLGSAVQQAVSRRYAGDVGMKHAKGLNIPGPRHELCVSAWMLRVPMHPERRELPHQRVKIEIANVDAFTAETMPVQVNHECVSDDLHDITIRVSTREEILADKLVSLPEAWAAHETNVRHRDIWDIGWLARRNTPVNREWVAAKRAGYAGSGGIEAVRRMIEQVPAFAASSEFATRMSNYLPMKVYKETLAQPGFTEQLGATCAALLSEVA